MQCSNRVFLSMKPDASLWGREIQNTSLSAFAKEQTFDRSLMCIASCKKASVKPFRSTLAASIAAKNSWRGSREYSRL